MFVYGELMKFLLVNTNAAVKKIFSIAARKASIRLDFANSIQEISIQEDYACIFVDDGVLHTGNLQSIKNKMITTKFCLIMSKDSETIPDFDSYIKKPFLPTDIYEVLKQEKQSDMNFSSFDAETQDDYSNINYNNINTRHGINHINLLDDMDDTNMVSDMNSGINNIDLSEFSDNDDEFLSGIRDSTSITNQNNEEAKFTYDNYNSPMDMAETISDSSFNILDESNSFDLNDSVSLPQDSTDFNSTHIFDDSKDFLASESDFGHNTIDTDNVVKDDDNHNTNFKIESNMNNINNNTSNDDIDFSSIFALQDEFLKDQNKDKPKGVIGGDIYIKKDTNSQIDHNDENSLGGADKDSFEIPFQDNNTANNNSLTSISSNNLDINTSIGANSLDDINDINLNNNLSDPSVIENQQVDSSNFSESVVDFDIDKLSDEELDELDDETLLKLQEDSIASSVIDNEPKILNKDDINEVATILEDTQSTSSSDTLDTIEFKMENNELDSLTQEALSEAIDETNMDNDFNFDNELSSLDSPLLSNAIETHPSDKDIHVDNSLDKPINFESGSSSSTPNVLSNPNLDLTEIVKSFPVDKLRELLSGVQITINITFPTKK